jgi:hypothetical protein
MMQNVDHDNVKDARKVDPEKEFRYEIERLS